MAGKQTEPKTKLTPHLLFILSNTREEEQKGTPFIYLYCRRWVNFLSQFTETDAYVRHMASTTSIHGRDYILGGIFLFCCCGRLYVRI